jgi:hypothetical protein
MGSEEHWEELPEIKIQLTRIADALENFNFQQIGNIKVATTKKDEETDKPIQTKKE